MSKFKTFIVLALLAWAGLAAAQAESADDAALAPRLQRMAQTLRCVVCQNQTLADSRADIAQDMKAALLEQMRRGASDAQVRDFMVQRYGDFVLYDPPFKAVTVLLWLGPLLFLALALALLLHLRRQLAAQMNDATQEAEQATESAARP
ncbi:MAG: cytochrome c-type biogenesis protein CcmH [Burkholderiaceae bacterium]|nr:cytochrome c-type biogenesis protein CcmH [Roseateles sp.]MBV8470762.1 cytochrome c-type biogenesis protein CcmH [Burkholderiaceae bacterium]